MVRWLKTDEVLLIFKTSKSAIYKLAHLYKWEKKRAGKEVFYSLEDIEQYLENRGKK